MYSNQRLVSLENLSLHDHIFNVIKSLICFITVENLQKYGHLIFRLKS